MPYPEAHRYGGLSLHRGVAKELTVTGTDCILRALLLSVAFKSLGSLLKNPLQTLIDA